MQNYYDLRNSIVSGFDLEKVKRKLRKISQYINDISIDIAFQEGAPHQNYNRLLYYNEELMDIRKSLKKIEKSISYKKDLLLKAREEWLAEKGKIPQWEALAGKLGTIPVEKKALIALNDTIQNALKTIDVSLKPILDVEQKLSGLLVENHALMLKVNDWMRSYRGEIYERNAPPVISGTYFRQLNHKLWKSAWLSLKEFVDQQGRHMLKNIWILISIVIVFILLTLLIYRSRQYVDMTSKWHIFTKHPAATALFICLTFFGAAITPLPPGWYPAFQFGIILTVMHLVKGMFGTVWKWQVVNRLSILILVTSLIRMVVFPRPLLRLIVLLIAMVGIFFCFWESCHKKRFDESPLIVTGLRIGTAILFVVLIAELIGYASFSLYLMNSFLMMIFAILNIWMLYLMVNGIIEFTLQKLPFPFIRKNAAVIFRRLRPIIFVFFVGLFCLYSLVIWKIYPNKTEALQQLFSMGITIGSTKVTVGIVFSAILVLYGSLLISWSIQALLMQEVLPRRKMELGSQISISRLVHYGIVLIGFLVALRVLGFGLTNLTIIGGALGVGVGFGLQAIVNNFASGLILLFERPIKVGDTIQVGNEMAVVKRLGLRATIVQTLDNAEIVVPNSDLVSSSVTNWTLANRRVRVRVPVGVAYGSDIDKVREILLSCAKENSKVLKYPESLALFLEFGDSSLNFELRVWVNEFMDSTGEVQDELNRAIDEKFREAGIEVPFPQTDLHLRSVDEEAAKSLRGGDSQNSVPDSTVRTQELKESS